MAMLRRKKLGRQNQLFGLALQRAEIGLGIAPKAKLQGAGPAPLIKPRAHLSPALAINTAQIPPGGRIETRGNRRDQAHRTAQHQARRGCPAAGGATLMVALRAKQMFKIVAGARQTRHLIAMEQTRPVASRHLAQVINRPGQPTSPRLHRW